MVNTPIRRKDGHIWWVILIALLGLLGLFAACDGGGQQNDARRTTLATALVISPPDSMHLYDSTFQFCRAAFDRAFSLSGGGALAETQQEMPWSDLADWLSPVNGNRAVRFEYGLRDSTFVLGLVRLKLDSTSTPGLFRYQLPDSVYELSSGRLDAHEGVKWREERQHAVGDSTTYFARVLRAKTGSAPQPLVLGVDAQADIMPWEMELQLMYDANKDNHKDSTFHAVFTCISKPDSTNIPQHRMAVHLRLRPESGTGYRDLLNNIFVPNDPFLMHGADFGNLCPPGCLSYELAPQ